MPKRAQNQYILEYKKVSVKTLKFVWKKIIPSGYKHLITLFITQFKIKVTYFESSSPLIGAIIVSRSFPQKNEWNYLPYLLRQNRKVENLGVVVIL